MGGLARANHSDVTAETKTIKAKLLALVFIEVTGGNQIDTIKTSNLRLKTICHGPQKFSARCTRATALFTTTTQGAAAGNGGEPEGTISQA